MQAITVNKWIMTDKNGQAPTHHLSNRHSQRVQYLPRPATPTKPPGMSAPLQAGSNYKKKFF